MEKEQWNQEKYQIFLEKLKQEQDLAYRDFTANLGIEKGYLIGVRTPTLKHMAKEISKTDYQTFIDYNTHQTYEERLVHGLLIGYLKIPFSEVLKLFSDFLPYIDNWAICDMTVSNMHIWKSHQKEGFPFIYKCLKSKEIWRNRVGVVLLLNYYIDEEYIDEILAICNNFQTEEYYVKMAIAWLLSICYIKEKEKTLAFLKDNQMDDWIQNKTIQKIRESNRIEKIEKDGLLKWKRKQ